VKVPDAYRGPLCAGADTYPTAGLAEEAHEAGGGGTGHAHNNHDGADTKGGEENGDNRVAEEVLGTAGIASGGNGSAVARAGQRRHDDEAKNCTAEPVSTMDVRRDWCPK
jgi:hypothetical protein